jgi:hypothetical protein
MHAKANSPFEEKKMSVEGKFDRVDDFSHKGCPDL